MEKTYDANEALGRNDQQPGQAQATPEGSQGGDIDYQQFIDGLPEEFRDEVEQALAGIVGFIHSEEGMAFLQERLDPNKLATSIGRVLLEIIAEADPDNQWSDSAKSLAGFFGVKEISGILREMGALDLTEEQEGMIYEVATKAFLHDLISSKDTQEEREAEAIRIQKEIDPMIQGEMRQLLSGGQELPGQQPQQPQQGAVPGQEGENLERGLLQP